MREVLIGTRAARVATYVSGDEGPTVVFIHGNSACKEVFLAHFDVLRAHGYSVLAPDLPGHGRSENARRPRHTYSFPGYARVICEVAREVAVRRPSVVGWSLGGHVALELFGLCRSIEGVLITGTPPIRPAPEALHEAFLPSPVMDLAGKRAFSEEDARRYATAIFGMDPSRTPSAFTDAVSRTDGEARFWMLRNGLAGRGMDERRIVESDPRLLAVVQGDHDPFVNLAYVRSIRYRNLWRGQVQTIGSAGHAPFLEYPDAFNERLLAFLDDVYRD